MATYANKMNVRNRMSVNALKDREADKLRFIENPKTGKLFFTCGSKTGYISPAVQKEIMSVKAEDLEYAECCIAGQSTWVPVIMKRGTNNVKREL